MAAETILLKVGESVISIAVGFIANQVRKYINDHFQFRDDVEANLKCLEADLQTIQAVLCEADKRRIENKPLGDWLQAIKDATYDAEDVLDMFEYKIIQEKEEGMASRVKRIIISRDASRDVVDKLTEVVDKFRRIAARRSDMFQLINSQPAVSQWVSEIMQLRESTSTPIKSVGRDEERAQLMRLLNQFSGDGGSRNFHVIPVVGIGGVGKTTLVQDVYNNQDVKHLFDLKAWVCVSDNFNAKRLTKEIIESASISKPPDFHLLENLDKIQQILQHGLKDQRFLIVLDDIWDEDDTKWEQLQRVLNCGKKGSIVVVTTRFPTIADMMRTTETTLLEGLADEEFQSFFASCAFGEKNPANYPVLKIVADKIAKKLKGNPLAAKTVGALLKVNLNGQYWEEVLQNELWKTNKKEAGIMQALRLSYEYLPSYLKQCFVYCSLFPKDYQYSKTDLVQMWIAHGFILPSGQQLLEKIGEAYFNELLSRSFIHETKYGYVIHDLLHDLAQSLSDGEIYIAENHKASPKKKVRHISICSNNLSLLRNDKLGNYENVRSLVVFDCSVEKTLDVLSKLKGLRVLVLRKFPVELSLKFIQEMLHLRYLELSSPSDLLQYLGKLYHLQNLQVERDYSFNKYLPNEINRLIKLPHLERHLTITRTSGIAWFRSLTLLQKLNLTVNQGEKGLDIGQIRDMSELTTLCLEGLETVKTKKQASQAMLGNKRHLKVLNLTWAEVLEGSQPHQNQNRLSNRRVPWWCWKEKKDHHRINLLHNEKEDEEDVLESLQPHSIYLEEFEIRGYRGSYPIWWNVNWPSNLNTLGLYNCSKWEILPPLGHLPFLKMLRIATMNAVRSIGPEFYASNSVGLSPKKIFPSLERLYIRDMPELKDWYKIEEEEGRFELFQRLKYFSIAECPKLKGSIFHFPPSNFNQIRMDISKTALFDGGTEGLIEVNCDSASIVREWLPSRNLLTSIEHLTIEGHEMGSCFPTELVEWIQHLTSLHSLRFSYCRELESPPSNLINSLSTLRNLEIFHCKNIKSLPEEGLPASLQKLEIVNCSNIKSLPEEGLPASLQELLLTYCEELEYLPSNLISLSTLRILNIKNCLNIESLPEKGLPDSLQELHVSHCYDLAKRCMNEYWQQMIAHIPTFFVDDIEVTEDNRKSLNTGLHDYSYAAKEEDKEEE